MTDPLNQADFTKLESELRKARPITSLEAQVKLAFATGHASGTNGKRSARIWQITSMALAACLAFVLLSFKSTDVGPQEFPNPSIVQNDNQAPQPAAEHRPTPQSGEMRTSDWRSFWNPDSIVTELGGGEEQTMEFGPTLRPTSTRQLINSI